MDVMVAKIKVGGKRVWAWLIGMEDILPAYGSRWIHPLPKASGASTVTKARTRYVRRIKNRDLCRGWIQRIYSGTWLQIRVHKEFLPQS
ncbi:MAG: hypothetical protein Q8P49_01975, partial [Candidatus Liptonbacteria bacterium]|nr:hypothetical protein [Candidatus Liptonbacteria bacterium]